MQFSKSYVITNQTLHNFFVNTSNASVMNVSCPLGIQTAAVTQNRSLFRNHRVALSVNSCGKSCHIEARQSSARQCWLVLAYVSFQYCTSHRQW